MFSDEAAKMLNRLSPQATIWELRQYIDNFLDDRVEARRRQDGFVTPGLRTTILRNVVREFEARAFRQISICGKVMSGLYPELSMSRRGRPPGVRPNGELIRELRRACALTQAALAGRSGVPIRIIQRAESGGAISCTNLKDIADTLNKNVPSEHAPVSIETLRRK